MSLFKVETGELSWTIGRNGTFYISALEVFGDDENGRVEIDCISACKGIRLNAGIRIMEKDMDELCRQWVEFRAQKKER